MLQLFDTYASLFKSWRVVRYEQEGAAYVLQLSAVLLDDSRLKLRDYLFADGTLRRRWDNAPHWPGVVTAPHHTHLPGQKIPDPSTVTNLEDLLRFVQQWFG